MILIGRKKLSDNSQISKADQQANQALGINKDKDDKSTINSDNLKNKPSILKRFKEFI